MNDNTTNFDKKVKILMLKGEKGDAGTSGDYAELENKPSINNVVLNGNTTTEDLGVATQTEMNEAVEGIENNAVYLRLLGANQFNYDESLIDETINTKIAEAFNGLYVKQGNLVKMFYDALEIWEKQYPMGALVTGGEYAEIALDASEILADISPSDNPLGKITPMISWTGETSYHDGVHSRLEVAFKGFSKVNGLWKNVTIIVQNPTAYGVIAPKINILLIKSR